jgi:hypothetical protein
MARSCALWSVVRCCCAIRVALMLRLWPLCACAHTRKLIEQQHRHKNLTTRIATITSWLMTKASKRDRTPRPKGRHTSKIGVLCYRLVRNHCSLMMTDCPRYWHILMKNGTRRSVTKLQVEREDLWNAIAFLVLKGEDSDNKMAVAQYILWFAEFPKQKPTQHKGKSNHFFFHSRIQAMSSLDKKWGKR